MASLDTIVGWHAGIIINIIITFSFIKSDLIIYTRYVFMLGRRYILSIVNSNENVFIGNIFSFLLCFAPI